MPERRETCAVRIFVFCDTRERPGLYTPDIVGSYIHFKTTQTGRQLSRAVGVVEDAESKRLPHTITMLKLGNKYNVYLAKAALTTVSEERGSWCRHVHRRTRSTKNYPLLGENKALGAGGRLH